MAIKTCIYWKYSKTARKAQSINPNCKHQKFKVPAGDSKSDQAPEEALMRADSKNRPVKKFTTNKNKENCVLDIPLQTRYTTLV